MLAEKNKLLEIVNHGVGSFGKDNPKPAVWIEMASVDEESGEVDHMDLITASLFLTPKAIDNALKQLDRIGWTGDDVEKLETPFVPAEEIKEFDRAVDLRGLRVRSDIIDSEFEGKITQKCSWLNNPDYKGGGLSQFATEIDKNSMNKLRMEAKARLKAIRSGEVKPKAAKTEKKVVVDDDELTF